jgi:radical SAM protein with 4Fe4S-binding SPASM domain
MKRLEAAVITTYRCMARCSMCNIWKHPTDRGEEFEPALLEKLPQLSFCNITGGEPFLRDDIEEIVDVLRRKSKRIVISTNGYLVERIVAAARRHRDVGFRISLEGLPAANDALRGMADGFDHGLRTLLELQHLGVKDVGFGITVSDRNAEDMLELFHLSNRMGAEFATAIVHNSYYFHTYDNEIHNRETVIRCFRQLVDELLRTWRIKNWYRAYFNHGLIERLQGLPRPLPCTAGSSFFFLDPFGDVRPCNGMDERAWLESMGNLRESSFADIWASERAEAVRGLVANCQNNCWMIGSASPAMKEHLWPVTRWVFQNRLRTLLG